MTSIENVITISSTGSKKMSTRHRVRFSHTTKAHFIPGLWEMSDEDIESTWLMNEDLSHIQQSILKTVKRMRQGREIDNEKHCARGLEYMGTHDLLQRREINKASARSAVLTEQQRQKLSGLKDPEEIRRLSLLSTKNARLQALRLAASNAFTRGPALVREQGHYCKANQFVEMDDCISVLKYEKLQNDAKSSRTNQSKASSDEHSSPITRIFGSSFKCDADNSISTEKGQETTSEYITSNNIFNKVFSNISRGLEGETTKSDLAKTNGGAGLMTTPDGRTTKKPSNEKTSSDVSKHYDNRTNRAVPLKKGVAQKTFVSKCA